MVAFAVGPARRWQLIRSLRLNLFDWIERERQTRLLANEPPLKMRGVLDWTVDRERFGFPKCHLCWEFIRCLA